MTASSTSARYHQAIQSAGSTRATTPRISATENPSSYMASSFAPKPRYGSHVERVPEDPASAGPWTLTARSRIRKIVPTTSAQGGPRHGFADHVFPLGLHPDLSSQPARHRRDDRAFRGRAGRSVPAR